MTRTIGPCRVTVSPNEVDAGADMTIKATLSPAPARDLRGTALLIQDAEGARVGNLEWTAFDGETNQTDEIIVTAPAMPGVYTWSAVYPRRDAAENASDTATGVPFSFTVKPHRMRVVVWDAPPWVECGRTFTVKFGVKCSSGCPAGDWVLEVRNHDGETLVSETLVHNVWPNTDGLYYTETELTAPDTEGLYTWEARVPGADPGVPHDAGIAGFRVRVVPAPDCVLTVEAFDRERRSPVEGARVVAHPYRALTNANGVAELRVPRGDYTVFVSGKDYFPFRCDCEVNTDVKIRAELVLDREPSDADMWS